MIAFDNGPPNGDYVRYIDALMARAAVAAAASVVRNGDGPSALAGVRGDPTTPAIGPSTSPWSAVVAGGGAGGEAMQGTAAPGTPAASRRQPADAATGFTAPTDASRASVAAAGIASALMSGEVGRGGVSGVHTVTLAMFVLGLALLVASLFWPVLGVVGIAAGIALMFGAARRLRPAIRALTREINAGNRTNRSGR